MKTCNHCKGVFPNSQIQLVGKVWKCDVCVDKAKAYREERERKHDLFINFVDDLADAGTVVLEEYGEDDRQSQLSETLDDIKERAKVRLGNG